MSQAESLGDTRIRSIRAYKVACRPASAQIEAAALACCLRKRSLIGNAGPGLLCPRSQPVHQARSVCGQKVATGR